MRKSIKVLILAAMTAIFVVLMLVPTQLSSDVFRTGIKKIVLGYDTCDCVNGGNECGCLTPKISGD